MWGWQIEGVGLGNCRLMRIKITADRIGIFSPVADGRAPCVEPTQNLIGSQAWILTVNLSFSEN
jgi:hypothetical protein